MSTPLQGRGSTPRRGLLLILSSPSGAGKSSLARLLLQHDPELTNSVSVTTRPRRHSEVDGVHYHFIDRAAFERKRAAGELLEWAEVHGNLYATPLEPVRQELARGRDMLFDIDWQGTLQIAKAMPEDIVRVFVLPPTMAELRERLIRRAEDDDGTIQRRLENARTEIEHWTEYDYVLVNDDLQESLSLVRSILAAERARRVRQPGLSAFVTQLLAQNGNATG
ncbi:MAG: guanylate kinase [Bauldia sp.]|nr:guanylate kinase [Bauldia sp.]